MSRKRGCRPIPITVTVEEDQTLWKHASVQDALKACVPLLIELLSAQPDRQDNEATSSSAGKSSQQPGED